MFRFFGKLAAPAISLGLFVSCASPAPVPAQADKGAAPQAAERPSPVTDAPWLMATASVTDIDRTARFFREIGGYETLWEGALDPREIAALNLPEGSSAAGVILAAPGAQHGWVRLVRFDDAGRKEPTRPGARAWDTGCFWSLMVRADGLDSIYDDAIAMGWWTQTPVANLDFGGSVLKVVVFQGPDGLQVQAYERLSPPLPEAFGSFDRISQPFNIMQMTKDREAARVLMEEVLGFGRYWYGPPHVDAQPTDMPLGIPRNLTTTVPYAAGIFEPVQGEFGRMEYIEIDGLEGFDHAPRCHAPNLGWLSVTYPVADAAAAQAVITGRGWPIETPATGMTRGPFGDVQVVSIRSPEGAWIEFQGPLLPANE